MPLQRSPKDAVRMDMSELQDYLKWKLSRARFARRAGGLVWAAGFCMLLSGLLFTTLLLVVTGSMLLFAGLCLFVYYEFRRIDYLQILERIAH